MAAPLAEDRRRGRPMRKRWSFRGRASREDSGKRGARGDGSKECVLLPVAARRRRIPELELRSGDLVLVKGRGVDKLSRLSLALTQDVTCWRATCTLHEQCDFCSELARPVQIGTQTLSGDAGSSGLSAS